MRASVCWENSTLLQIFTSPDLPGITSQHQNLLTKSKKMMKFLFPHDSHVVDWQRKSAKTVAKENIEPSRRNWHGHTVGDWGWYPRRELSGATASFLYKVWILQRKGERLFDQEAKHLSCFWLHYDVNNCIHSLQICFFNQFLKVK